ncbi:hypothetical protein HELRODRAFT_185319 [Helobdella robusta]|uniref:Uncharacterized protein n=1 Tax=Helobdella robusta TaxID=6412 RepID=T1FMN6_HELRO|nr:hypothetical protein HELRODRAFT_185319 [Helobdella robusta]ESO10188.1 hypothetical protein HELRODRAFT_185319 [Helobdella robusta]
MSWLWRLVSGPQLYRVYNAGEVRGSEYEGNVAERFANSVIKWMGFCGNVCYWSSPVVFIVLYRKGFFMFENLPTTFSYVSSITVLLVLAHIIRAFGRAINDEYCTFLNEFFTFKTSPSTENKEKLRKYDCSFSEWPVEYVASKYRKDNINSSLIQTTKTSFILNALSYVCVRTFGIRLLYPGCCSILQTLMGPALTDGREKLVKKYLGRRTKIRSSDANDVDCMFVDRRITHSDKGSTLSSRVPSLKAIKLQVIVSEGNAGFYEIGCMSTPLDAGYSVLGWNHPGFSGSTGLPLPDQEQNAIDAVMQYSINVLGFQPPDIILFAWSIGGYTASWAAMNYPDVKCVILDATFDHILPLARARMPPSWSVLINLVIPNHLNLNNAELLCNYPGKLAIIRRTKDEMISISDSNMLASNRGNVLLQRILSYRYPNLIDTHTEDSLERWFSADKNEQNVIWKSLDISEEICLEAFKQDEPIAFPSPIGEELTSVEKEKLVIFLVRKYISDFDSTHCTPLPSSYFREPKYLL